MATESLQYFVEILQDNKELTPKQRLYILNQLATLTDQLSDAEIDITLKQDLANTAAALTDGAAIALTSLKHTLTSAEAAITFSITYTGDDITVEVTLNNTSATYTFPATALCISEGTASGDNTATLSGVSGDKYIIAIKKIGSNYYVAVKNFGQ